MSEPKSESQLLEEISTKMDKVLGWLAIAGRDRNDQIKILRGLGFEWSDIGPMVGLDSDTARMRFSRNGALKARKRSKKLVKGAK